MLGEKSTQNDEKHQCDACETGWGAFDRGLVFVVGVSVCRNNKYSFVVELYNLCKFRSNRIERARVEIVLCCVSVLKTGGAAS